MEFNILLAILLLLLECTITAFGERCKAGVYIDDGKIKAKVSIKAKDGVMRFKGKFGGLEHGEYPLRIHESGDITQNCLNVGRIYNPLNETLCVEGSVYSLGMLNSIIVKKNGIGVFFQEKFGGIRNPFNLSGRTLTIHEKLEIDNSGRVVSKASAAPPIACGIIVVKCR